MPRDTRNLPRLERRWPNNIGSLRKDRGLQTRQLADKAGIPVPTLFGLQSGRLQLTQERVRALAEALGCRPENLFIDGRMPARLPSNAEARSRRSKMQPRTKPGEDDVTTEKLVTSVLAFPRRRRSALLRLLDTLQKDWS